MLLDVLSGHESIQVAVAYEDKYGERLTDFPADLDDLAACRPVYKTFPGWSADLTTARTWGELPLEARNYIEFLASELKVPVSIVSVGPDRRQTIHVA